MNLFLRSARDVISITVMETIFPGALTIRELDLEIIFALMKITQTSVLHNGSKKTLLKCI